MKLARITSKGQVTIPAEVRRALGLEQGDYLLFQLAEGQPEAGEASVRVVKGQSLTSLYGSMRSEKRFPGKAEIREKVGRTLGRQDAEATSG